MQVCRCKKCDGLVKPDIVFFGEHLPDRFIKHFRIDLESADLLVIMGTSLIVHPFASLVNMVPPSCPRVLLNREAVGEIPEPMHALGYRAGLWFGECNVRDVKCLGECDDLVHEFANCLGWSEDLQKLISQHKKLAPQQAGEAEEGAVDGEALKVAGLAAALENVHVKGKSED
jgi:NAD+-dependent protein deacetylase sirtuin 2